MVNKAILIGNVGGDPEIRHIDDNTQYARFTLATTERYKNKQGETISQTEWHNIIVWRGLVSVVERFVKKGTQLYIEGRITTRSYEKDGITRYFTEIVANNLRLLGRRNEDNNYGQPYQNQNTYQNNNSSTNNYAVNQQQPMVQNVPPVAPIQPQPQPPIDNMLMPDDDDDLPF